MILKNLNALLKFQWLNFTQNFLTVKEILNNCVIHFFTFISSFTTFSKKISKYFSYLILLFFLTSCGSDSLTKTFKERILNTRKCNCSLKELVTEQISMKSETVANTPFDFSLETKLEPVIKKLLKAEVAGNFNIKRDEEKLEKVASILKNNYTQYDDLMLYFRLKSIIYCEYYRLICEDKTVNYTEVKIFHAQKLDELSKAIDDYFLGEEEAAEDNELPFVEISPNIQAFAKPGTRVRRHYCVEKTDDCEVLETTGVRIQVTISLKTKKLDKQKVGREIESDYWYFIKTPRGTEGWVFGHLLIFEGEDVFHGETETVNLGHKQAYVRTNRSKLRSSILTHDETNILARLDAGTPIRLKERTGKKDTQVIKSKGIRYNHQDYWYKIYVPSHRETGWLFGYFVSSQQIVFQQPTPVNQDLEEQANNDITLEEVFEEEDLINPETTQPSLPPEEETITEKLVEKTINKPKYSVDYIVDSDLRHIDIINKNKLSLSYSGFETGTVVIKVIINKYGKVIHTRPRKKGTNTSSPKLIAIAEELANKFKFEKSNTKHSGNVSFYFKED